MAKKSVIVRNLKRSKLITQYAQKRQNLKQTGDYLALDRLPKNASPVRWRNRCAVTGRGRGYMRKFQISRIVFRKWAAEGKLPGITKASW